MPKARKTSISSAFLRFTSILSTLSILFFGMLWIGDDLYHFNDESESLRQEFLETRKREIRQEVGVFLAKIKDQRSTLEDALRNDVRERVREAWSVADNIYRLNVGRKSTVELAEMIREALRPIRYNNGRGYFFATGMDGVEQLFSDRPELEGHNLLDMTDTNGKPVIRDMIRIARDQGEGYYEYLWTKPGAEGKAHRKLAFIKHFPGLDWLIGTGEYMEDVESDLQAKVLQSLEYERYGEGEYLFAGTMDGISLTGPTKGEDIYDVVDVNGLKVIQEIIGTAKGGGGFVEYVFPGFSGGKPHRKLSYVAPVEGWHWHVGAGVNVDAIEEEIERRRAKLWSNTYKHSSALFVVLLLILASQYLAARRATERLRSGLSIFMDFFRRAQEKGAVLIPDAQPYAEMEELALSANAMIEGRLCAEKALLGSEARYRRLVDNTQDGIFLSDKDGRILDANKSACQRLGYTHAEITAMRVGDVDLGATPESFAQLLRASTNKDSVVISGRHHKKDGSSFPVEILVTVFWEEGQPLVLGIARDITERFEAEEQLRQSEEKFVHLFQSSPDAIFLVHLASGQIREANEACVRFFAHSREEMLGRTCHEIGIFTNLRDRDLALSEVRQGRVLKNLEVEMMGKDAKVLTCLMSSQSLDIAGEAHALSVFHDITEQKKIQEMMIQSEKMVSVGGIAAGIAHEINNPLGIIVQTAQNLVQRIRPDFKRNIEVAESIGLDMALLEKYMQARKILPFVQDMQAAALRAADIIRHMLDFSRRSESRRAMCELPAIVDRAIALAQNDYDLKKSFDFKRIRIVKEYAPSLVQLECTETELEQVFLNLLRNAAQAMSMDESASVDPRIVIRLSNVASGVRCEFEDNGPGMPAEVRRRVFEPFYTTKPPGIGTGLGLSVSYFIVTSGHGGKMWVESAPGAGTRFIIELPGNGLRSEGRQDENSA